MKAILIAMLLLIFSAQGCVVAVGANLIDASNLVSTDVQPGKTQPVAESGAKFGMLDLGDTDVFPSIEEMSDYVSIQISDNGGKESVMPPSAVTSPYISIVLPKVSPPPRA